MGACTWVFVLISPLIILHLIPHPHHSRTAQALTVVSADGTETVADTNPGQAGGASPGSGGTGSNPIDPTDMIGRNSVISDLVNILSPADRLQMWMVVICEGMQARVRACRTVPTFSDFMQNAGPNFNNAFAAFAATGRKKRFASSWSWGPSWSGGNTGWNSNSWGSPSVNNNPWQNDPWQNDPWQNPTTSGTTYFTTGSNNNAQAYICPTPIDQSMRYMLSADSANYPAAAIGTAITADTVLQECLAKEVVLPTDGPQLVVDPFRLTANLTCPYTQLRLWSYTSPSAGGIICWVIQNFQEDILYRNCTNKFCSNCKDKNSTTNSWGLPSTTTSPATLNQKLCITDYRRVSLWAFCPDLATGNQIIRGRIIVPFSCCCQSVACEAVPQWKKRK